MKIFFKEGFALQRKKKDTQELPIIQQMYDLIMWYVPLLIGKQFAGCNAERMECYGSA